MLQLDEQLDYEVTTTAGNSMFYDTMFGMTFSELVATTSTDAEKPSGNQGAYGENSSPSN